MSGGSGDNQTTSVVQQQFPDWFTGPMQNITTQASQLAQQPYNPVPFAQTAGFTPDQQQAFTMYRNMAGAVNPQLQSAQALMQGAGQGSGASAASPFFAVAGSYSPASAMAPYLAAGTGSSGMSAAQPYLDAASGASAWGSAQPFMNQAAGLSGAGAATPWLSQGANMSSVNAASPLINQAASTSSAGSAAPLVQQGVGTNIAGAAQPYINQGLSQNGARAAMPFLRQGTESFPQNVSQYMSPYTQQVTDRIAQLGAQNLSENLLPAVNDTFIGSGQFGGSRNADFTNRAIRDTNQSILGQQASALEQGYSTAGQLFNQDQARQLQAAQTLGNLTGQQGQLAVQAGLGLGGLTGQQAGLAVQGGLGLGNLTAQDAARQLQAGTTLGNMTNADAARLLQAGSTLGQLTSSDASRLAQMAAEQGNLANQDRSATLQAAGLAGSLTNQANAQQLQAAGLASQAAQSGIQDQINMGQSMGQLTEADAARQLQAGQGMAGLAGTMQQLGQQQAAGLSGIGAQQQALNQTNINQAIANFQAQQNYPWTQLQRQAALLNSARFPTSSSTSTPGPSTTAQILGLGTAGAGILDTTGAFGSGGWLSGLFGGGTDNMMTPLGYGIGFKKGGMARLRYASGGDVPDINWSTMPEDVIRMAAQNGDLDANNELLRRDMSPKGASPKYDQPDPSAWQSLDIPPELTPAGVAGGYGAPVPQMKPLSPPPIAPPGIGMPPVPLQKPTPPAMPPTAIGPSVGPSPGASPGPSPMGMAALSQSASQSAATPPQAPQPPAPPPQPSGNDFSLGDVFASPLVRAGAAMMSSRNPRLLGAVGEGLSAGAQAAQQQKEAERQQDIAEAQQKSLDAYRQASLGQKAESAQNLADYRDQLLQIKQNPTPKNTALMANVNFLTQNGIAKSQEEAFGMLRTAMDNPAQRARMVEQVKNNLSNTAEGAKMTDAQRLAAATQQVNGLLAGGATPSAARAMGTQTTVSPQKVKAPATDADGKPIIEGQILKQTDKKTGITRQFVVHNGFVEPMQ